MAQNASALGGSPASGPSFPPAAPHPIGIQGLPYELRLKIFSDLNVSDIPSASRVCREWNQLFDTKSLWSFFLQRDFQLSETEAPKELYQKSCLINPNLARGIYSTRAVRIGDGTNNGHDCHQGQMFISSTWGSGVKIWNLEMGVCEDTLSGYTSPVARLVLTSGGKLVTGSWDGSIKVWNLETRVCEHAFPGHGFAVVALVLTNEGKLISVDGAQKIRLFDLEKGVCERILYEDAKTAITSLVQTKDGRLISGEADGKIKIRDSEGRPIMTLEESTRSNFSEERFGSAIITTLALTEDGKLVSGSDQGIIKIWNLETGKCEKTLDGHEVSICSLIATKGGKLISGSDDGMIKLWDLGKGNCEITLDEHPCRAYSLILTEDDKLLLSSSCGKVTILDFNASNGEVLEEIAKGFAEDAQDPQFAMQRFLRMPVEIRGKIYAELYEMLKPFSNESSKWGARAFHDRKGISSTPQQKAQAIRNYLSRGSMQHPSFAALGG